MEMAISNLEKLKLLTDEPNENLLKNLLEYYSVELLF